MHYVATKILSYIMSDKKTLFLEMTWRENGILIHLLKASLNCAVVKIVRISKLHIFPALVDWAVT